MAKVRLISLLSFLLLLAGCSRDGMQLDMGVGPFHKVETRKVMLLYEAGFNSLGYDITSNIATLKTGYLPGNSRDDDVMLVMSHVTARHKNYLVDTSPALVRMYQVYDQPVFDTLKVWPAGTTMANADMVHEVFTLVKDLFPAAGYGAVLSSHGTGWVPKDYFNNSKAYDGHYRYGNTDVWAPKMRTFGQEYYDSGTKSEEIELKDLAAAIPYKLDYILFDACLMATVEVAWALRDVCDYLAASPCEIPSAGFDYSTLAERLLKPEVPDLKGACEDYFARYEKDSVYGAAISMVDSHALDGLADVCRTLFETYRSEIRSLDGSEVAVYDRAMGNKNFYLFFDLKDLLREAGATDSELAALQAALDEALVYEAHTRRFITVDLSRSCGLATYLPAYPDYKPDIWHGTAFLDGFYQENVAWNEATEFVK